MSAVTRNDLNAGVLQTFLNETALENLRAELYFYQLGTKPTVKAGFNTVGWGRFTKLTASAVTSGTTSNDGVTPSDTAFNAEVITATPTQYRVVVTLSDVVIENNVLNFLEGASKEVGSAMAEKIDAVIQTEVMAGTNVLYASTATQRTEVTTSMKFTASLLFKAHGFLKGKSAKTIGGYYVAIMHPFVEFDLKAETGTGSWLDSSKYAKPDNIFKGEIGALGGIRVIVSANVQTFTSTTTVYPTLVLGMNAYGVSDFQKMRVYITPAVASDSDPLAQRRKVGAKVMFATKRLEEDAMLRIESYATSLA